MAPVQPPFFHLHAYVQEICRFLKIHKARVNETGRGCKNTTVKRTTYKAFPGLEYF